MVTRPSNFVQWTEATLFKLATFLRVHWVECFHCLRFKLEGSSDAGHLWKGDYENENFEEEIKSLFDEVRSIEET